MTEDNLSNKSESDLSGKLQKIKEFLSVSYGAGATVAGVATGNPFLAASGIISFFGGFISTFANRNQNKFFTLLKSDLEKLKSKIEGFDIDQVLSGDKVLSAILEIYPIVLRTYQEEKLQLLRNVILNITLTNIDHDLQSVYLNFVDDLTPTHIKILKFLENPNEYMKQNHMELGILSAGNRSMAIPQVFPELKDTYVVYLNDLDTRQLIMKNEMLHTYITKESKNITVIGSQFLEFIESPLKDE